MSLLEIRNLTVQFGPFPVVDGLNLTLHAGELVGIVGESGSGKSMSALAIMGLLDGAAQVSAESILFDGQDLMAFSQKQRRGFIGKEIAMIFQDPFSSLNPAYTVGAQLMEVLKLHTSLRGAALRTRALELFEQVELPGAASRLLAYPHQLSGGMCQRVMIAIAIACHPKLLIADEPTTALDVTVQAQIMDLLVSLQKSQGMSMILISHDLSLVAEVVERVVVMYAGQVVETNQTALLFNTPRHPYTQALLASMPEHRNPTLRLASLPGAISGQYDRPEGCLLSPRCAYALDRCKIERPVLRFFHDAEVRCFTPLDDGGNPTA